MRLVHFQDKCEEAETQNDVDAEKFQVWKR